MKNMVTKKIIKKWSYLILCELKILIKNRNLKKEQKTTAFSITWLIKYSY